MQEKEVKCAKNRGRLRRFLSCGLIYGYWEHKSFTSIHTSSTAIHSPEHLCENKPRDQNTFVFHLGYLEFQSHTESKV